MDNKRNRFKFRLTGTAGLSVLFLAILSLCACNENKESSQESGPLNTEKPLTVLAGIARISITPTEFERFDDVDGNNLKSDDEPFFDTGVDRLQDRDEPGAMGTDLKPGVAGVDDDQNGMVDDAGEYLSAGSDDVADPNGDNFHAQNNPAGTEQDGTFQTVVLAGYEGLVTGDDIRPALDVHDEIYVTSLAVTCSGQTLLLVSLDLVGLWYHYMNPIKRRLEEDMGIPFENIIMACTHTHAGPDSVGLWAYAFDTAYPRFVMERMYESAKAALESREPAYMKSTTVIPDSCYEKQSKVFKQDNACNLSTQEDPNMDPDSEFDRHTLQNDLRDPWVRNTKIAAIQFNRPGGSTLATLVNFHNHPEVFGQHVNVISSDYPHYTRTFLENRFGGTAIFFTGTVGNQIGAWDPTPVPLRDEQGSPVYASGVFDAQGNPFPELVIEMGEDKVRSLGLIVGEVAAGGLASAGYTMEPELHIRTGWLDVVPENLMSMGFSVLIMILDEEFPKPEDHPVFARYCPFPGCARVPLSVVHLGDASLVSMPGEVAPEYMVGRDESWADYPAPYSRFHFPAMPAIEDELPGRDKFLLGQANAYFGYFVPASDFLSPFRQSDHPNYYEDELCPGPNFGNAVGNKIFQMLGSDTRYSDYPIRPNP